MEFDFIKRRSKKYKMTEGFSIQLPELDPKFKMKVEPHLMKDSYKKVHVYLFDFNILLGKGNFSHVYKGINLITNEDVAVKVIDMSSVSSPKLKQLLLQEIDILMKVKHQNLIKCFEVLSSSKNTYIIMQLCTHDLGSVCEFMLKSINNTPQAKNLAHLYAKDKQDEILEKQTNSKFNPTTSGKVAGSIGSISSTKSLSYQDPDCSSQNQITYKEEKFYSLIRDIFQGLEYLIKNDIVHRDLKLSNIFIKDSVCKIGDLGFATKIPEGQREIKDTCCIGSPLYMSPQSYLENVYSRKSDIWSFGVLIFQLIYGNPPLFSCPTHEILKSEIKKEINWDRFTSITPLSEELLEVLKGCLQIECRKRFSIEELRQTKLMKWLLNSTDYRRERKASSKKSRYEESTVEVYNTPYHSNQSKFQGRDNLGLDFQFPNQSIIPGLQKVNNSSNKSEQNYTRSIQRFNSMKANNSCLGSDLITANSNPLNSDRALSSNHRKMENKSAFLNDKTHQRKQNNKRAQGNGFSSVNRFLSIINDKSNPKETAKDSSLTKKRYQAYLSRETSPSNKFKSHYEKSPMKNTSSPYATEQFEMKFKSTDLNGNIFREIEGLSSKGKEEEQQKRREYSTENEAMQNKYRYKRQSKESPSLAAPSRDNPKPSGRHYQSYKQYFKDISNNRSSYQFRKENSSDQNNEKDFEFTKNELENNASVMPNFYVPKNIPKLPESSSNKIEMTRSYNFSQNSNHQKTVSKPLQKHTSSPRLHQNVSQFEKMRNQSDSKKQMSCSHYFGQTARSKELNMGSKQNLGSVNRNSYQTRNQENIKKTSTNDYLSRFSTTKTSELNANSTLQKKSYWKTVKNTQRPMSRCQAPSHHSRNERVGSQNIQLESDGSGLCQTSPLCFQSKQKTGRSRFNHSKTNSQQTYRQNLDFLSKSKSHLIAASMTYKESIQMVEFTRLLYKISFNSQFHSQAIVSLQYSESILEEVLQFCNNLSLKPGEDKSQELNSFISNLSLTCDKECGSSIADINRGTPTTGRSSFLKTGGITSEMTLGELSKTNQSIKNIVTEYLKKFRGRKEALVKLSQNEFKQSVNLSGFKHLSKCLSDIEAAKLQLDSQQEAGSSTAYKRKISTNLSCSEFSINQREIKCYLKMAQFYVQCIEKGNRTGSYRDVFKGADQNMFSRKKSAVEEVFDNRLNMKSKQYSEYLARVIDWFVKEEVKNMDRNSPTAVY